MNYNYIANGSIFISNLLKKKRIHIAFIPGGQIHIGGQAITDGKVHIAISRPEKPIKKTISYVVDDQKIEANGFIKDKTLIPAVQLTRNPYLKPTKKKMKSPHVVYTKNHQGHK